jgi:hypothetical protein
LSGMTMHRNEQPCKKTIFTFFLFRAKVLHCFMFYLPESPTVCQKSKNPKRCTKIP